MAATRESKAGKAASTRARQTTNSTVRSPQEQEALNMALAHLTENGIKPRMTLKEFAEFFKMDLRQVQSDFERKYLPRAPRSEPGRRELLQVNVVAYYANMYLDAADHLNKSVAF